ncbi:flippase-like domain-containing protein [Microcoleus sp. FACHB-831]|nr:lysylphosphatidylglycerol synthase domain-containing protein [Microcoleus sp. FACHB-831]MBD1922899.1 flippase-like domain-containing protein [Microcoleus sp. FACHB-831]
MPKIWSTLKPYLRWVILGGTLFFLAKALKDHAAEVSAIRITGAGWANIAIALCLTLLAHTWAGWVWNLILQSLQQPVQPGWVLQVYLKTNLAKYLPGNVWHYYGRILAVTSHGGDLGAATLSVLLEPLLMAAAALLIALLGTQQEQWGLQVISLAVVCLAVHPRILNPAIQFLSRMKGKSKEPKTGSSFHLKSYPLLPLLGELGFLVLRGAGFLFVLLAVTPINPNQIPTLFSAFSMAWLLGLVVPGAPGGIGVFEATATALLNQHFSPGLILSAVALFRVVSILAEVVAAGMATASDRLLKKP